MGNTDRQGWVKLNREFLDHPRFADGSFVQAYLFLLLNATHAERDAIFGKDRITLKPGQLITSRKSIAQAIRVSESKVERLLTRMETERQIEQQGCTRSRLITLLGWQSEQQTGQQNEQQSDNKRTTSGQQPDTNKNGRREEWENEEPRTNPSMQPGAGPADESRPSFKDRWQTKKDEWMKDLKRREDQ